MCERRRRRVDAGMALVPHADGAGQPRQSDGADALLEASLAVLDANISASSFGNADCGPDLDFSEIAKQKSQNRNIASKFHTSKSPNAFASIVI